MRFTGTLAHINLALASLTYTPPAGYWGAAETGVWFGDVPAANNNPYAATTPHGARALVSDPKVLLSAHPTLMKRPVIEIAGQWHVGWGPDVQKVVLG